MKSEDIKYERETRGIKQGEFANMLGISNGYLSQLERGVHATPPHIIERCAYALARYDAQKKVEEEDNPFLGEQNANDFQKELVEAGIIVHEAPAPVADETAEEHVVAPVVQQVEEVVAPPKIAEVVVVPAKTTQDEKDDLFLQVAFEIAETLARKNHDYGDSFYEVYKRFGDMSTFIRLMDKLGRLESLVQGKDMKVANEPLEDVYRDIAGYCILSLVSKQRLNKGEK